LDWQVSNKSGSMNAFDKKKRVLLSVDQSYTKIYYINQINDNNILTVNTNINDID